MNIANFRRQIDDIDSKIIELIEKRLKVVIEIAEYKKGRNIEAYQPGREKELLKERRKIAKNFSVKESLVEKVFQLILEESRSVQYKVLGLKKVVDSNIFDIKNLKYKIKELDLDLSIFDVFTRVYANFDTFFFLESLGDDKDFSRYSYIGFGPKHIIKARKEKLWIDDKEVDCNKNPWEFLKQNFPSDLLPKGNDFKGGLVGYASYEAYRYKEPNIKAFHDNKDFYDFEFGLYLEGIRYNLHTKKIEYFTLLEDHSNKIFEILKSPIDLSKEKIKAKGSNFTDEEFEDIVEKLKEEIVAGNIFQIVPTRKYYYEISGSTLEIYKKLRAQNPSPHMFFLKFGERQLIGSSPELVARVENNRVESYPIAGTRSRGKTPEEDLKLEKELLADEKECAEHMMLVDMARDDLGRVCEYGTVKVDKLKIIKKFSHVQHIVSHISGELAKDKNMFDAVMTSFPMGTVSGAPRIEAVKLIYEKEKIPRGPYSGFAGFFSFSGEAVAALSIRSLFINGKDAYAQAGAGVVFDSVPEFERKEVDKKVDAIKKVLGEKT